MVGDLAQEMTFLGDVFSPDPVGWLLSLYKTFAYRFRTD